MQSQFTVVIDACGVKTIRARLNNPPRKAEEYLFTLFHELPQTVSILKKYTDVI